MLWKGIGMELYSSQYLEYSFGTVSSYSNWFVNSHPNSSLRFVIQMFSSQRSENF